LGQDVIAVFIKTSRKRRGELSGHLKVNTMATIGKYFIRMGEFVGYYD